MELAIVRRSSLFKSILSSVLEVAKARRKAVVGKTEVAPAHFIRVCEKYYIKKVR